MMILSNKYKQNLSENWLNHIGNVKRIVLFVIHPIYLQHCCICHIFASNKSTRLLGIKCNTP